ncbi:MAG: trigger factor [Burkholderiales bacterium]|nr:trigger factor [Burkholderiales bacterium]
MQSNLETLSELERRLDITLPAADIATEVETRLKRLTRTVRMQGFRPGKVPLRVVTQHYGPQVRQEVMGAAVEKSFGEAVRQQNLRVAGSPRFEVKPLADGAPEFRYSAIFEVYPEVTVGDVARAGLVRPRLEVGDAEVERTIEIMRKQRARYVPVDRAAVAGDRVTLDFQGTIDGAAFAGSAAQGQRAVLGEGQLLPDLEAQLIGMKRAGQRAFDVRFPDDYHGREVAGKTARFEVTVNEVAEPELPALDAEFAKGLGVADGDLAKMRAEVKTNLEREVRLRLRARARDQVMQALLDATRVEPPRGLVQMEIERLRAGARQDLAQRGVRMKEGTPLPAEVFEPQARRRVCLGLILAELVRTKSLQARAEQVRALVDEQAQSYERPEEVVKWYYAAPERLRDLESAVVEQNVVEWALATAGAREQTVNFDELMGNR